MRFCLGVVVIKMQAVIEVPFLDTESARPWPVASLPAFSWLVLDADCAGAEVGLFVAALADRLDVAAPAGRDEVVAALLAEEILVVAGGLRLFDTVTEVTVVPGCCAGLEDWRDWGQVLTGSPPWLGHDPWPVVEIDETDHLRVRQDGGPNRHSGPWAAIEVALPRHVMPDLLRNVQQDLIGFLAQLKTWTQRVGLVETGTALTEAIDRHFAITAPLDIPTD